MATKADLCNVLIEDNRNRDERKKERRKQERNTIYHNVEDHLSAPHEAKIYLEMYLPA